MTQDYAKRQAKNPAPSFVPIPLKWFSLGFVLGLFIALLLYLWHDVVPDPESTIAKPTADVVAEKQQDNVQIDSILPDYSFFEMFPKVVVPVVEEYSPEGKKVLVQEENYTYALQVGSFKNNQDAQRFRAKLILMGMQVTVKEAQHKKVLWHRVLVGPFDSKTELNRTKTVLATADIESIQLRVKQ